MKYWIIFAFILSAGAVLAPHIVNAQAVCGTGRAGDVVCSTLGPQFQCISNRCNLPPPIWNTTGTGLGTSGQSASFDVQGASRVRGDFTVGTTAVEGGDAGNLRVNAIYSRLGQDASDTLWLGGTNNLIRVQGRLAVDDGATVAGAAVLTQPAPCLANQVLKRNPTNTAWTCAPDATGAAGGPVLWNQLTGFPDADGCPVGEFVTTIGATITCAAPVVGGAGLSGGLANKVAFWRGAGTLGQNVNFHWDDMAGRLGIGTPTPAYTLDLRGDRISLRNALGNAELDLQSGTDTPWAIYAHEPSDELRFWRVDNRMRLTADGNLTITGGATIGADLSAVNVVASTQIRTPSLCLGSDCRVTWPTAGGGGGGGGEPLYTTWYNNGDPTIPGIAGTNGTGLHVNGIFSTTTGADNIWIGDNNDTVQVQGSLAVGGCLGPVYRRPSAASRDGNRGGYLSANAECPAGMRVCGTAEILESINCGALALPGVDSNGGVPMWINNLAPSLPTPTNDCGGWRTNAGGSVGVVYSYNATGGVAGTAACNSSLRFACCQ